MNEQLTLAIVGAYHGCEVKYRERIYSSEEFSSNGLGTALRLFVHNCQLVITPVSEISNQDAIEVSKITNPSNSMYHYADHGRYMIRNMYTLKSEVILSVYDLLRSRGYDCGYGPIRSLIDANLAVDKTKIKL